MSGVVLSSAAGAELAMARSIRNDSSAAQDIERQRQIERAEQEHDNKRRHGRLRPEMMWCNLGKVLDFSATGLRLSSRRALSGEQVLVLKGNNQSILVHGTVVWSRRCGFMRHQAGIQFLDLSPADAVKLRHMAVCQ